MTNVTLRERDNTPYEYLIFFQYSNRIPIGGFYLLSYFAFKSLTGQSFITQQGKEAQSTFESLTKINDAPIAETRTYVVNWLDPAIFSRFRTNKDFIAELIDKYQL